MCDIGTVGWTETSGKYSLRCSIIVLVHEEERSRAQRTTDANGRTAFTERARAVSLLWMTAVGIGGGRWWFLSTRASRVRFGARIILRRQYACGRGTAVYFDSAALVVCRRRPIGGRNGEIRRRTQPPVAATGYLHFTSAAAAAARTQS